MQEQNWMYWDIKAVHVVSARLLYCIKGQMQKLLLGRLLSQIFAANLYVWMGSQTFEMCEQMASQAKIMLFISK